MVMELLVQASLSNTLNDPSLRDTHSLLSEQTHTFLILFQRSFSLITLILSVRQSYRQMRDCPTKIRLGVTGNLGGQGRLSLSKKTIYRIQTVLRSSRVLQLKLFISIFQGQFHSEKVLFVVMMASQSFPGCRATNLILHGRLLLILKSTLFRLVIILYHTFHTIQVMIIANMQTAIHFKLIRNLTGITSGRFSFRIGFSHTHPSLPLQARPLNVIQKEHSQPQNTYYVDQTHYTSKNILLKSAVNAQFNQVVIFQLKAPLFDSLAHEDDHRIVMTVELLHNYDKQAKIVDTFSAKLPVRGGINQYLQMDFYDGAPCQVIGSLHTTMYRFEYLQGGSGIDLKGYCQKYSKHNVPQVLQFLEQQARKNYKVIAQTMAIIGKEPIKMEYVDVAIIQEELREEKSSPSVTEAQIFLDKKMSLPASREEDLATVGVDEAPLTATKKKRIPIFKSLTEQEQAKIAICERVLHAYSQKIYETWRSLTKSLMGMLGDQFVQKKGEQFRRRLREKVQESVSRFKGSWDVDQYSQQAAIRGKMAYHLRHQHKQYDKQVRNKELELFPVINSTFFSQTRPIFFEQNAVKEGYEPKKPPKQLLIFLVHGLGACRLDMERLKVELRRYFDKKVRIFTSSSNQGRTQGDIQGMGSRFAAEVDYELSKYEDTPDVCMVGHSMGGVIIRCALPRLCHYKDYFHSLITLSSPHMGYSYSNSTLIDAGLWIINNVNECQSIMQLTMKDAPTPEQTFIYDLSSKPGPQWFNKIVLMASNQDLYVPFYSARIQKHDTSALDQRKGVKKGVTYCKMIDNLLNRCCGEIIRVDVNFEIPQQNLDNLIGRAAHISFLTNTELLRTLVIVGQHYFF